MSRPDKPLAYQVKEKPFMETILRMAKLLGWLSYHTFDSRKSTPGFPDIVAVHPEHGTLYLEAKTMRGKVSAAQQEWIDVLTAAGERAFVVRPDQMDMIEALFRGEPASEEGQVAA